MVGMRQLLMNSPRFIDSTYSETCGLIESEAKHSCYETADELEDMQLPIGLTGLNIVDNVDHAWPSYLHDLPLS